MLVFKSLLRETITLSRPCTFGFARKSVSKPFQGQIPSNPGYEKKSDASMSEEESDIEKYLKDLKSEDFSQVEMEKYKEINKYFLDENEESKDKSKEIAKPKFDLKKTNRKTSSEIQKQKKEEEEENKVYDKEKIKFIQDTLLYPGEDVYPRKLVHRPEKGVVWGLGGELLKRRKSFFEKGRLPDMEEFVEFLELEQAKDVTVINLEELGRQDLGKWGIIASTFSCRHNFRTGKNLVNALKDCEIPNMSNPPRLHGRKDDEWIMVWIRDVMVHLFVQEAREEVDLEWKWRNPVKDEDVYEFEKIAKKKKNKGLFEPFIE